MTPSAVGWARRSLREHPVSLLASRHLASCVLTTAPSSPALAGCGLAATFFSEMRAHGERMNSLARPGLQQIYSPRGRLASQVRSVQ